MRDTHKNRTVKKKTAEQRGKRAGKQKKEREGVGFFRGIQFKLVISFFIPVICIVALGVSSYQMAAKAAAESYQSSMEQTMQMVEDYIRLVLDTKQTAYKEYLMDDDLKKYFSGNLAEPIVYSKRMATELKGTVTSDELLANIYFIAENKEPITTTGITGTDAFQAFLATPQGQLAQSNETGYLIFGNQCEADQALGTNSDTYSMRMVKKLIGSNAYMMIDFDDSILQNSLAALNTGDGSYVGLITCDGMEFLMKDGQYAGGEAPMFAEQAFYQEAVSELDEEAGIVSGAKEVTCFGEEYLFLYRVLGERNAMITVLIPGSHVLAQAEDIRRLTVIVAAVAILVALVLGNVMAGSFGRTIRNILKCLKKISAGDLTVEVHSRRQDEFGLLTKGIFNMTSHMKGLISDVNEVSGALLQAAEEVSQSSEMFMSTAQNIKQSISEIEKGINLLDSDSANCLTQMDGLSSKITSVSGNSEQILKMTDAAEGCISQGMDATGELTDSAVSTSRITSEVIAAIEELENKTNSIGKIVEVINEIAAQTNLLSLNASIEAARAGASGRGFAVVAEEIRKLADQSLEASGRIAKIIDEMSKEAGNVAAVAKEAETVVASQTDAVNATIASFKEIGSQVSGLLEALQLINSSVRDMDSDRSATLGSIESISAVSAQTASSSMEVYEAADKQIQAIQGLEDASGHLKKRATQLGNTLSRFKL